MSTVALPEEWQMDLTRDERELLDSYLHMDARGKGWIVGAIVGAVICGGALLVAFLGPWDVPGVYLLLVLVVGMVLIELSLGHRDKLQIGRILQEYDTEVRRLKYPEEEEETA